MADSKARILYITPAGQRGGAEVVLINILSHLDRGRFEPNVVCLQDGCFVDELRERTRVPVDVIPALRFSNLNTARKVIKQLRRIIRDRKIALVHSNGTGAHLYGGAAARLCGVPNVFHMHDLIDWSWSGQGLVNLLASTVPSTATIAISDYAAKRFREAWPAAIEPHIIRNSIELEGDEGIAGHPAIPEEFGWPADAPLVVWCGRLQRWKGPHVFLNAAALVRERAPEARFLVVGGTLFGLESDYEKELRTLAQSLHLDDHLRFTGYRPDAKRFIAAAELVVHSSVAPDPFGLVVLEGMALGKPVIASAEGGPTELIENEVTGLLFTPGDEKALAQALVRLLRDESLRKRLGLAARRRVETHFSVTQMMQKLEGLYNDLLNYTQPAARTFGPIV